MGLRSAIKKYKVYEAEELARRKAKKKKLAPYKELKEKSAMVVRKRPKFKPKAYTKAIGNPYGVNFPKAKKTLKKVKKKKVKRRVVVTKYVYN